MKRSYAFIVQMDEATRLPNVVAQSDNPIVAKDDLENAVIGHIRTMRAIHPLWRLGEFRPDRWTVVVQHHNHTTGRKEPDVTFYIARNLIPTSKED